MSNYVALDVAGDEYTRGSASSREAFTASLLAHLRTLPQDEHTPQKLDLYEQKEGDDSGEHFATINYDGPPGDWYVDPPGTR